MKVSDQKKVNKMISDVEQILADLSELHAAYEEACEGKSDTWKESEKGEAAQEEVGRLEEAVGSADDLLDKLNSLSLQE